MLAHLATTQHHHTDPRKIAHRHARPGGGERFAVKLRTGWGAAIISADEIRRYGYQWFRLDIALGKPKGWPVGRLERMRMA